MRERQQFAANITATLACLAEAVAAIDDRAAESILLGATESMRHLYALDESEVWRTSQFQRMMIDEFLFSNLGCIKNNSP